MDRVDEAEQLVEEMQNRIENITSITENLNKSQRPSYIMNYLKKGGQ